MISKWENIRSAAIALRKTGKSIRDIEKELNIPRSTLSGWFRTVYLTTDQKNILLDKHVQGLISARKKAVLWHNEQKSIQVKAAERSAEETLSRLTMSEEILELALAFLYLGEGSKKNQSTVIGNSDPLIIKFFLKALRDLYHIETKKIKLYLHLRFDQNPEDMKAWWSKTLDIPLAQFGKCSIDKRTSGSNTYEQYKGVCVVHCGNVAIQRKLVYISRKFCEKACC